MMPDPMNAFAALEEIEAILKGLTWAQRQWVTEVAYEKCHDLIVPEDEE